MLAEFWKARDDRERKLLLLAAALFGTVLSWQFVYLPSSDFRRRTEARAQAAQSDLAVVASLVGRRQSGSGGDRSGTPVQSVVTDTANVYGLSIGRIEPSPDGSLTLWFDKVSPSLLYAWLLDLEQSHGVRVGKASLRLNQDGETVSANIFVERG